MRSSPAFNTRARRASTRRIVPVDFFDDLHFAAASDVERNPLVQGCGNEVRDPSGAGARLAPGSFANERERRRLEEDRDDKIARLRQGG